MVMVMVMVRLSPGHRLCCDEAQAPWTSPHLKDTREDVQDVEGTEGVICMTGVVGAMSAMGVEGVEDVWYSSSDKGKVRGRVEGKGRGWCKTV